MPLTNKEIIEKAGISTTDLNAGGILLPAQAKKFIQMIFDATALLQIVRTIMMKGQKAEYDKIGVGQRLMRGASESGDVSSYTQKPIFGKIELDVKKYVLPWEFSTEALEDNIEGKNLANIVAEMFATQIGLDTEDLAVNGNDITPIADDLDGAIDAVVTTVTLTDASTYPHWGTSGSILIGTEEIVYEYKAANVLSNCTRGANGTTAASHADAAAVTWVSDVLIGNDDGWLQLMRDGDSAYVDLSAINTGKLIKDHFFDLFRAMPQKYTRGANKSKLRWMMSSTQKSLWDEYLTNRATGAGDSVLGGGNLNPLGIPIIEVPSFPQDTIVLTVPKNLIVGVWREVKVRRTDVGKTAIMTDSVFYNTTLRKDFEIEETEAIAWGDGLVETN